MNLFYSLLAWYYSSFNISDANHEYRIAMCVVPVTVNLGIIIVSLLGFYWREYDSNWTPFIFLALGAGVYVATFSLKDDHKNALEWKIADRAKVKFSYQEHLLFTLFTFGPVIIILVCRS